MSSKPDDKNSTKDSGKSDKTSIAEKKDNNSGNHAPVFILIGLLVLTIIYVVILFECYKSKTFIFTPYTPSVNPPADAFHPTGKITPLTQEQINERNAYIKAHGTV